MSTHSIDVDYIAADPALNARYTGFLGFLKAFSSAISEGTKAHDDYHALTRNGVPHDKAVRHVLTRNYDAR